MSDAEPETSGGVILQCHTQKTDLVDQIQETKRVIPKFTSFKPSIGTATTSAVPKAKDEEDEDEKHADTSRQRGHRRSRSRSCEHERRHRRRRDHRKDGGEHRRRHHREGSSERLHHRRYKRENDGTHERRGAKSPLPKTASLTLQPRSSSPKSWDAPQKQYFMDTKGDEHNLLYGTIHRYSIPDYRRGGAGRIVGLSTNMRIDRDKGDGEGLVLRSGAAGREESVKSMRQAFAKLESKELKRLRIKDGERSLEEAFSRQLDFVPLSIKSKKRKTRDGEPSDGSEDDHGDHYRSIEGPKKAPTMPDDPELDYVSESQSEGDYITNSEWGDRKRMVELVRMVDAEPKNIDAWVAYVNHYDALVSGTGRRKTAAEKSSTAEIKVDILRKGLEKNPGNERLLLKYMEVAEEIWGSQKLLTKWTRVLEENPTIISLWTKYINFRQTDFLSFTYPECLKCFSDCLNVLRTAAFRTPMRDPNLQALDEVIFYIFVRTILLMDESGYKENAVAAVQAMLELNFFMPHNTLSSTSQSEFEASLEQLERFWDSEVPRIGEEKALGWASYSESGESSDPPKPVPVDLQLPPLDNNDPFGSWTDAEVEWSQRIGMPARTIDEVEEDDPYRVILFSDLKAFLFCFSSEDVRKKMVDAFLIFKNLPLLTLQSSNNVVVEDMFLHTRLTSCCPNKWFWPMKRSRWDAPAITWEGMEPEKKTVMSDNPFQFKLRNFPLGRESIFTQSNTWFGGIENLKSERPEDAGLIRNTLKMLVDKLSDESVALYYLAWEWGNEPSGIKKATKSLLKRFKTSLSLWSAYAQIEWHDSGVDAGRKVFSMALGMIKDFSADSRHNSILVWHAWIWQEIWQGNIADALHLILSIENGRSVNKANNHECMLGHISKATLLRARRFLDDQQQTMLSIRCNEHAGEFNDIRALLEYLAESLNLDAALAVYDEFVLDLERRSIAGAFSEVHELCLIRKARLVYLHSTTAKPFKPTTLRSTLEAALEIFPRNSAFLSLYAWNESRTKIENRLRTLVRNRVLHEGNETVMGWLFAIWAEMGAGEHYNVHAVRSLFEQGVGCGRTRSSVQLWMMFVEFELRQTDAVRAKDILFRGIRHCPWSRDLILMAFTRLRSALEVDEFRRLLSIMTSEKELRVHDVTDLEDMVEEIYKERGIIRGGLGSITLPDDYPTDEEMDEE